MRLHIRSTAFILFFISLSVLAGTHILSLYFFLYWTYLWLDIPVHVLGGATAALGFLSYKTVYAEGWSRKGFLVTAGVVIVIGILWEIFQYVTGLSRGKPDFVLDTSIDLVMDVVGGAIGFYTAHKTAALDRFAALRKTEEHV